MTDPDGVADDMFDSYERLAPVWAAATDDGLFNAHLERPALRGLVPQPVSGRDVLDAGCAAGANCEWLIGLGARVTGIDLSPAMIAETERRCGGAGRFVAADLGEPLPFDDDSFDGIVCSLTLHYLEDWSTALESFARVVRPAGWVVVSVDHPAGPPLPDERGTYFDTRLVHDTMTKAGVSVPISFWRRSFGASVAAFRSAGFAVDAIVEPQPTADAVARFHDELGPVVGRPCFVVYRLRLE